jgi:hypothetical protein
VAHTSKVSVCASSWRISSTLLLKTPSLSQHSNPRNGASSPTPIGILQYHLIINNKSQILHSPYQQLATQGHGRGPAKRPCARNERRGTKCGNNCPATMTTIAAGNQKWIFRWRKRVSWESLNLMGSWREPVLILSCALRTRAVLRPATFQNSRWRCAVRFVYFLAKLLCLPHRSHFSFVFVFLQTNWLLAFTPCDNEA